jgi:hypothetical protein
MVVAIASQARDISLVGRDCVGGSRPEPHVGLPFEALASLQVYCQLWWWFG